VKGTTIGRGKGESGLRGSWGGGVGSYANQGSSKIARIEWGKE
jgi:hypothetical protein